MTTTVEAPARATTRTGAQPVTFARTVAAEWIKLRSLRSTSWSLLAYVVIMVGIPLLMAIATAAFDGAEPGPMPTLLSAGTALGQLVVVVLGVLAVTGEYSTGLVRATFAAVPRRLPVLAAKAVVLAVVVAVSTVVAQGLTFLVTLPFHSRVTLPMDLGDAETIRLLVGPALYMAAVALLGLGVGALMRHTAGAITTVVGLLLVVESVIVVFPQRAVQVISSLLPSTAGSRVHYDSEMLAMMDELTNGVALTPWQGYGVLLAWVAVLLTAAAVLLRHRDA